MKMIGKTPVIVVVSSLLACGLALAEDIQPAFTWHATVQNAKDNVKAAKQKRLFSRKLNLRRNGTEKEDRISQGGTRVIESGSTLGAETGIVVEKGTVIVSSDLKGDANGDGQGKITLQGRGALLIVEENADIDVDTIEVGKGAEMVVTNAKKLRVKNWNNNGRIIFDGSDSLPAEGILTNNGEIYLANPNVPAAVEGAPPPSLNIVNNGTISTGATAVTNAKKGDLKVGVIDANVECNEGGILTVMPLTNAALAASLTKRDANQAAQDAHQPLFDSAPTGGAYMQINGSLNTGTGTMNVTIDSTYYGQYAIGLPIFINGAHLNVTTTGGYNPPNATQFLIIKAKSIGGTGFATPTVYTPSTTTYSHSISMKISCENNTRQCYPLYNVTPTPFQ